MLEEQYSTNNQQIKLPKTGSALQGTNASSANATPIATDVPGTGQAFTNIDLNVFEPPAEVQPLDFQPAISENLLAREGNDLWQPDKPGVTVLGMEPAGMVMVPNMTRFPFAAIEARRISRQEEEENQKLAAQQSKKSNVVKLADRINSSRNEENRKMFMDKVQNIYHSGDLSSDQKRFMAGELVNTFNNITEADNVLMTKAIDVSNPAKGFESTPEQKKAAAAYAAARNELIASQNITPDQITKLNRLAQNFIVYENLSDYTTNQAKSLGTWYNEKVGQGRTDIIGNDIYRTAANSGNFIKPNGAFDEAAFQTYAKEGYNELTDGLANEKGETVSRSIDDGREYLAKSYPSYDEYVKMLKPKLSKKHEESVSVSTGEERSGREANKDVNVFIAPESKKTEVKGSTGQNVSIDTKDTWSLTGPGVVRYSTNSQPGDVMLNTQTGGTFYSTGGANEIIGWSKVSPTGYDPSGIHTTVYNKSVFPTSKDGFARVVNYRHKDLVQQYEYENGKIKLDANQKPIIKYKDAIGKDGLVMKDENNNIIKTSEPDIQEVYTYAQAPMWQAYGHARMVAKSKGMEKEFVKQYGEQSDYPRPAKTKPAPANTPAPNTPAPKTITVQLSNGQTGEIPASSENQFLKDNKGSKVIKR